MVFEAPISTLSMVGGGDIHREPFRYRHLCYDDDAPDPDLPPAGGAVEEHGQTDQTLTVAMLQMAPAALSDASVELNAQKAESFASEAKSKGADIVVMPEQWICRVAFGTPMRLYWHTMQDRNWRPCGHRKR